MSCILYYSNFCNISKKYLNIISKFNNQEIHFICIDKRIKESNKTYILLENGQKILLFENVTHVPALLLMNNMYKVLYGESILDYLKPKHDINVREATNNNMEPEPLAFSFGENGANIVSDQYSFIDQDSDELKATGNGGMRQLFNYADINSTFNSNTISHTNNTNTNDTTIRGSIKMQEDKSNQLMEDKMQKMKAERDNDMQMFRQNKPPF